MHKGHQPFYCTTSKTKNDVQNLIFKTLKPLFWGTNDSHF
jgi:hypothetical protein